MFCSDIIWKKRLGKAEDFLGRYGLALLVIFVTAVETKTGDKDSRRLSVQ
jgi:hypothetical protein